MLAGANLCGLDLSDARLESACLEGARLVGACLDRARLTCARAAGVELRGSSLRGASLVGCDLRSADLRNADLSGADLSGALLRCARLDYADLSGVRLRQAHLGGADLTGARLLGVDLQGAILDGCGLQGAAVGSLNLDGASQRNLWLRIPGGARLTVDGLAALQLLQMALLDSSLLSQVDLSPLRLGLLALPETDPWDALDVRARAWMRSRDFLPISLQGAAHGSLVRLLLGIVTAAVIEWSGSPPREEVSRILADHPETSIQLLCPARLSPPEIGRQPVCISRYESPDELEQEIESGLLEPLNQSCLMDWKHWMTGTTTLTSLGQPVDLRIADERY